MAQQYDTEKAILGVLNLLTLADEGCNLSHIPDIVAEESIYGYRIGKPGIDPVANPYVVKSKIAIKTAIDRLIKEKMIEAASAALRAPLIITEKGRSLFAKMQGGMNFDEALAQPEVQDQTPIETRIVRDVFREVFASTVQMQRRINSNVESVKQGLLRMLAEKSRIPEAEGEVPVNSIIFTNDKTLDALPGIMPGDILAQQQGYNQTAPQENDFFNSDAPKAEPRGKMFNPYFTRKEIRDDAWQSMKTKGWIKQGKDRDHVRLTPKGWEAVDTLRPLTRQDYDFMSPRPSIQIGAVISGRLPAEVRKAKVNLGDVTEVLITHLGNNSEIAKIVEDLMARGKGKS